MFFTDTFTKSFIIKPFDINLFQFVIHVTLSCHSICFYIIYALNYFVVITFVKLINLCENINVNKLFLLLIYSFNSNFLASTIYKVQKKVLSFVFQLITEKTKLNLTVKKNNLTNYLNFELNYINFIQSYLLQNS